MLGNYELAISLADEGIYAVEAPLADRAQLHVIKAAAMLKGGTDRAVVRRQLTSACLICRDAGSALGFAMLPSRHRSALLDLGHVHPGGGPCFVAETVARGAFNELRQNCDRRSDLAQVKLTRREKVLLPLLLQPLTIQEVADRLFVSANTVRKQVVTLRQKLGASSRSELVERATELGIGTTAE
jgi:DNA-binding CsgD family transcriptional regulator